MPRGLFQMGTLGWTPAAQLATQNQQGAAQSLAAMDKEVNQTQTTKVEGSKSNIFGDIMPIVGAAAGFALGGPAGMAIGSSIGGGVGSAMGGQGAATLGGLGTVASGSIGKVSDKWGSFDGLLGDKTYDSALGMWSGSKPRH